MNIDEIKDGLAGRFNKELDHVFKEQLKTYIIIERAEEYRRYIDKYGTIPSSIIAQLNCVPTKTVDAAECCSLEIECNVIRTINTVPSTIRTRGSSSTFTFVGSVDGKKSFSYISPEELPFLLADRFLKNKPFYSYINNYIYIFNINAKNIKVRGVFNDPFKVVEQNDCDGDPAGCLQIVDIPTDFVSLIEERVLNKLRNKETETKEEEITVVE